MQCVLCRWSCGSLALEMEKESHPPFFTTLSQYAGKRAGCRGSARAEHGDSRCAVNATAHKRRRTETIIIYSAPTEKIYPQVQAMKAEGHLARTLFGHTGMERLVRRFIELISTRDVRALSGPRPSGPKTQNRKEQMKTFSKITLAAAALALLGITALSTKSDEGKHSDARWKTI